MNVRETLCVAGIVFGGLLEPSLANPVYQVTDLGFDAVAINDRGQVVGNNAGGAVLWDPVSGIIQIGAGTARDINDSGRVLGVDSSGAGWIWDPVFGLVRPTGLIDPTVINDRGQVGGGGSFVDPGDFFGAVNPGYLWDPTFGYTTINPARGSSFGFVRPVGINNLGAIVGWQATADSIPAYWSPELGQAQILTVAVGTFSSVLAGTAIAINDAGQIAGVAECNFGGEPCASFSRARLWTSFSAPAQTIGDGYALDINNLGWVVGSEDTTGGAKTAFLWSESFGLLDLNSLVSPSDPLFGQVKFRGGTEINDRGQILADGRYLLNTIPEPGTFVLVALGLVGLILATPSRRR